MRGRSRAEYGFLRSTLRGPWRMKKTTFTMRGFLWPLRLRILRVTCTRPPGGVQRSPALIVTRPSRIGTAGAGGGGGGGGWGSPTSVRNESDAQPDPIFG